MIRLRRNDMPDHPSPPVLQLRVALTSRDLERLERFYLAGLGLEPTATWRHGAEARGVMLPLGHATLELFDEPYAAHVDALEAGARVSGPVRLALQVPDLDAALARLVEHGATVVHPPVTTPWGDRSVRLQDPEGLQVTLFEEADRVPGSDA
jgi:uncharacterized glyoxalase superfamily protein PhnB